jgi:membrane protease YdiL (CAAX protease family)
MPMAATLVVTIIFTKIIEKGKLKIRVFGNTLKDSVLGVSLGCIWFGISILVLTAAGSFHLGNKNTVTHLGVWVLAVLLNVIMQEYLVRGYLFQLLKEKCNTTISVIVTTIIFTAMHPGAIEAGIIPVFNVVTMSLFVSALLIYTKNLLSPIIVHFIWNTVGGIFIGGVSLAGDYPSIWNSAFSGNVLISGGSVKIEGSIVVLVVNLILIAIVSFFTVRKNKMISNRNLSYIEN